MQKKRFEEKRIDMVERTMIKEKTRQIEKVFMVCLFFLIWICIGLDIDSNVYMSFDLKGVGDKNAVVYWHTLNDEIPYAEEYSNDIKITSGETKKVWVKVPKESLKNIRLDLGNVASEWTISDVKVVQGVYSFNLKENDLIGLLGYQNDVEQVDIEGNSIFVVTSGADGYLVLNNVEVALKEESLIHRILNGLIVFLILPLVMYMTYQITQCNICIFKRKNKTATLVRKVVFFVILIIDSLVISYIWDRILLKSFYYGIQESNLLIEKYVRNIIDFSIDRIFFWFIFVFAILLCIAIGFEKSFKYRYIISLAVFVYLVIGQYHGSSIGYLSSLLTEHEEGYEQTTLLGINQGLRGDEWAVWTPFKIAQTQNEFEFYNNNLMLEGCDTMVAGKLPSYDMMSITRQKNWGYFFLPLENAFSFEWWSCLFLIFLSGIDFMYEITERKKISVLYAVILIFSPPIQWWNSLWVIIYSGQYFLVALSRFLKSKKIGTKIGYTLLASISAISYIFDLYPAWMVPFAYVFLIIGIWILWRNRDTGLLKKSNIFAYVFVFAICAIFAVRFLMLSTNAMVTQMSTNYPGSGQWVKVPYDMPMLQIINFFMGFGNYSEFLNNCEISQFYGLFVWSLVLWIFWIHKKKKSEAMYLITALVICAICFLYFMYGPRLDLLYKVTLLSFTYPRRVYTAFGYCTLLVLFMIISETKKVDTISSEMAKKLSGSIVAIVIVLMLFNETLMSYFEVSPIVACFSILLVEIWGFIGYTILTAKRRDMGMILYVILTVMSTICVNPINRGLEDFTESTLIQAVCEIEESNEDEMRWMVDGNTTIANIISACGVKRTTGTYIYPDYPMMQIIDPDCKYENEWNRYAHINMELGEENYISNTAHGLSVVIDSETAEKLEIGYIVTNKDYAFKSKNYASLKELYRDSDNWHIYEIEYRH